MQSFRDVIAKWPSIEALADDVGAKPVAVLKWRVRGTIPPRYWPALVRASLVREIAGVTHDKLEEFFANQQAAQRGQSAA